jgi:hypothetical protein
MCILVGVLTALTVTMVFIIIGIGVQLGNQEGQLQVLAAPLNNEIVEGNTESELVPEEEEIL